LVRLYYDLKAALYTKLKIRALEIKLKLFGEFLNYFTLKLFCYIQE